MICLYALAWMLPLHGDSITLAWTHSIEKIRWEEDYRLDAERRLHLLQARIRGSGAGMEPPEGARLAQGTWHYRPELPALAELTLTHSPFAPPYELCRAGVCRTLTELLPLLPETASPRLAACEGE